MSKNDKADIWMPLYIGDYLSDTTRLTTEQHGAYLLLIMDYWKSGRLPDDDIVLAQITRMRPDAWSNARAMLEKYFSIEDGFWIHHRIEREKDSAREHKQKATTKAKHAAEARWGKDKENAPSNAPSIPQAIPQDMLVQCPSPSPSPSPLPAPPPAPSVVGSPSGEPAKKSATGTRLPPEWTVPDEYLDWALSTLAWPQSRVMSVGDSFRDYWIAQPGVKGRKTDWFATWRNWCRREPGKAPTRYQTLEQRNQAAADAFIYGDATAGRIIDVN